MAGYFGSDLQMRLQRLSDESIGWTLATPGACCNGRMLGADDIGRLGWDTIRGHLLGHGAFGFRMVEAGGTGSVGEQLAADGCRVDWWDAFLADRDQAMKRRSIREPAALPPDLALVDLGDDPGGAPVRRLQEFLAANGLAPFSGSMLLGHMLPGVTIALGGEDGGIAAMGFTYLPHNLHSPWRDAAFIGLIAVAAGERGRGLGGLVNAMLVNAAFERLGAARVYALASPANTASRRMIEACGLALNPDLKCGIAVREGGRFTA